jgi:hypothetical protein
VQCSASPFQQILCSERWILIQADRYQTVSLLQKSDGSERWVGIKDPVLVGFFMGFKLVL